MPEQRDFAVRVLCRRPLEIVDCQCLSGDRADETHVEVLFPADEGIVRAAERDADTAVREQQRQRGKLRL